MRPNDHLLRNFYVVTPISNPVRFRQRYELFKRFRDFVQTAGGKLVVVELVQGDRAHQVTAPEISANPYAEIQLRTREELWFKENMLNIAISRLPENWEYVAWVDADLAFTRRDWLLETVEQLQHFAVVQMWQTAVDLGPTEEVMNLHKSFGYVHWRDGNKIKVIWDKNYDFPHPGYAWAARREFFDHVGGLIDGAILGAADTHMAFSLIGRGAETYHQGVSANYKAMVAQWQERALDLVHKNVGFVPGTILHYWHGKKADRRYQDRWKILVDNKYDPVADMKRDWQGLLSLDRRRTKLRDDIRKYFRARNEDSIDLT